jgi:hypothetical protein
MESSYDLSMTLQLQMLPAQVSNAEWLSALKARIEAIGATLRDYRSAVAVAESSPDLTPMGRANRTREKALDAMKALATHDKALLGYQAHINELKKRAPHPKPLSEIERLHQLLVHQEIRAGLADRDPLLLAADYGEWAHDTSGRFDEHMKALESDPFPRLPLETLEQGQATREARAIPPEIRGDVQQLITVQQTLNDALRLARRELNIVDDPIAAMAEGRPPEEAA